MISGNGGGNAPTSLSLRSAKREAVGHKWGQAMRIPSAMLLVVAALPALVLAGCSDPAAEPATPPTVATSTGPPPAAPAIPPAPVVAAVPFTWSGHTKEGAWVCMEQSGLGQCPAGQQVAPDGQHVTTIPYQGNLSAIDLAMAWHADPTQAGLVLAVYANRTGGLSLLAATQGDAPLTVRVDVAPGGLPADGSLVLMVWPEGRTATSPSLFVDATQQPFTVEGLLWQDG